MAAIVVSVIFALIHGIACITFRGNQIVSGVAINFLAAGLTAVIGNAWFSMGGRTPPLPAEARFRGGDSVLTPFFDGIPGIGPWLNGVILDHTFFVYVAFAAVPFTWWVLYRTRFGLRMRAVGENHDAAHALGYKVVRIRLLAIAFGGACVDLGGPRLIKKIIFPSPFPPLPPSLFSPFLSSFSFLFSFPSPPFPPFFLFPFRKDLARMNGTPQPNQK